jgi:serine/threonine-protein kinase
MTNPTSPAACPQCGAALQPGAAFCMKCGAATGVAPREETGILERLQASLADRYRIERQLGQGGMATVFLAHDLRHERDVAIKVLHPELAASMGAERFEREIKLAAKLHHPHILSLFDSGEADSLFYYVMPFVPGESLRDRITREQMLPVDDALQITYEVADALGAAHALGIVHRDIKPENILLAGGHALVADFGVARAASEAGEKLTQTGMAVGTPTYMSPEQAMGDPVGPTSDLYALGCVAYEMLTGQPPFTGANARAIMARHTMEAVPSLRLVRDSVSEEVEEAILSVLAKVPADRPQTAKEFLDLLSAPSATGVTRRIGSRLTTPRRTAALPRRTPWWKRPVTWAAAAVVLAAGGGALLLRHGGGAAGAGGLDPHRIAVLYFGDESAGAKLGYLADGLTEGLIRALREVRTLSVVSSGGVAAFRKSDVARDSIARALGAGTLVLGDLEDNGGRLRVTVRLVDGVSGAEFNRASFEQPATNLLAIADTLTVQAARLVRARLGEEIETRELRDQAHNPDAWSLYQRADRLRKDGEAAGDTTALARGYAAADSLLARAQQLDPRWANPPVLRGELDYLRSRQYGGDPPAADQWIGRGLTHVTQALTIDRDDADALELRGNLRYWRWLLNIEGDSTRAKQLLQDAKTDLETATKLHPSQAGAWATLSHLYYQTGSLIDVNLAARNALEQDAFLSNADAILKRLYYSSYDLGQFSDAAHWCEEGRRRFPANPTFTECRLWLMTTRQQAPDPRLAWRLLDSVVALTPAAPVQARAYQRLYDQALVAGVLARAGAPDSARRLLQRSRADAVTDPSRDIAYVSSMMYVLLGDKAAALDQLKVYLAANPNRRAGLADDPGWQFASLKDDPVFRQLVGAGR